MKPLFLAAVFALGIGSSQTIAAPPPQDASEMGQVVSRINRTLILLDQDEKANRKFDIPADAQIIFDGEPAKLDRVQAGDFVTITFDAGKKVTKVDAKSGKSKVAAIALRNVSQQR